MYKTLSRTENLSNKLDDEIKKYYTAVAQHATMSIDVSSLERFVPRFNSGWDRFLV